MDHRRLLIATISVATAIKLYLAIFTVGTNDVITWQSFISNIHRVGGSGAYHLTGFYGDPFNHPPFMIHVLLLLDWISRKTQVAFPTALRLLSTLADIGTVVLSYRMHRMGVLRCSGMAILALALCPISILISGFHGNTDPIFVFFLVVSVYMLLVRHSEWTAGLAFGLAINIKVLPLLLIPVFIFHLSSWRRRIIFFAFAAAVVLIGSLPYLLQDPEAIIKGTLGYRGFPAPWGVSNILHGIGLAQEPVRAAFRVLVFIAAIVLPRWMSHRGFGLHSQISVILLLFLLLTPAFGVQYLAWPVPFILSLELGWVVLYYVSAGAFLFLIYEYWSGGHWYFAESHVQPSWNRISIIIAYFCWGLIALLLINYRKRMNGV
jgi:hypothetical protein